MVTDSRYWAGHLCLVRALFYLTLPWQITGTTDSFMMIMIAHKTYSGPHGPCDLRPLYLTIPCILRPDISDTISIFSV